MTRWWALRSATCRLGNGFSAASVANGVPHWLRRSSHRATSALMRFSTSRALIFEGGSARLKFRFHLLKGGLRTLQRTFSPLAVLRIRRFLFAALRLPGALRFSHRASAEIGRRFRFFIKRPDLC